MRRRKTGVPRAEAGLLARGALRLLAATIVLTVAVALQSPSSGIGSVVSPPAEPSRMILTGVPPFGAAAWTDASGAQVPAGCGPLAARMLLAYYDERFGYAKLVRADPQQVIVELHDRMHTLTLPWIGEGFTDPFSFQAGLTAYVSARYPGGITLEAKWAALGEVFQASVALTETKTPQIILFDWGGVTPLFPNHYAVVVGFSREQGRQELVINPGWGYDFQVLDMTDVGVAPAILFWIKGWSDPPDGAPCCAVGPVSADGVWTLDASGSQELAPVLHAHFDPARTLSWPASSAVEVLVDCPGTPVAACYWP